jgi:hypothetical protein
MNMHVRSTPTMPAHAADRVFLGDVTALALPSGLHAAWGLSSLAVKLIAVAVQGAGDGIPVGTIRMPPVSLVCIPAGLPGGRDVGRMPADPGWSRVGADISPGIIRQAGSVRRPGPGNAAAEPAAVVPGWRGAGGCGCPERRRPVPVSH